MNSVFMGVIYGGDPTGFQKSLPPPAMPYSPPRSIADTFSKVAPPGAYEDWVGRWGEFGPVGQSNAVVSVYMPLGRSLKRANIQLDGSPFAAWDTLNGALYPVGVILNGVLQNSAYEELNVQGPTLNLAFTMHDVPGGLPGHFVDCYVTMDNDVVLNGQLTYPL